jgi:ABC-2 type transport system ATP-binding protein
MVSDVVVELDRVTKRFAGHTAVRDFSLSVPRGSVYGLLGPNGAGKSTSIRMILSILRPDSGTVSLFGERRNARGVSHRIGYLPEERGLYRKMRVLDLLVFLGEMRGQERSAARRAGTQWLERLGLADWMGRRTDTLSRGMQQKVQFIATVMHGPDLLILDEPFAGLDPVNAQVLKDAVMELAAGGATVLFSTHIMEQAERLCDAVCIIARGEKLVDGPVSRVKATHGGNHVILGADLELPAVRSVLDDRGIAARVDAYGGYAEVELASGADPQRLLERLIAGGARVSRFEVAEPTLHKVFLDLVGPTAATAAAVPEAERHA